MDRIIKIYELTYDLNELTGQILMKKPDKIDQNHHNSISFSCDLCHRGLWKDWDFRKAWLHFPNKHGGRSREVLRCRKDVIYFLQMPWNTLKLYKWNQVTILNVKLYKLRSGLRSWGFGQIPTSHCKSMLFH